MLWLFSNDINLEIYIFKGRKEIYIPLLPPHMYICLACQVCYVCTINVCTQKKVHDRL